MFFAVAQCFAAAVAGIGGYLFNLYLVLVQVFNGLVKQGGQAPVSYTHLDVYKRQVYTYCGLEIKRHFFFDKANKSSVETIEQWTMQIKEIF